MAKGVGNAEGVVNYIPMNDWAAAETRIEQLYGCR